MTVPPDETPPDDMPASGMTTEDAAQMIIAAAGVAPGEVPPRPFGADWFREQPPWLAASTAADRLVQNAGLDPAVPLSVAAAVLEEEDEDLNLLIEVGFVEAMVCSASHGDGSANERILTDCPASLWQVWHRRRERLEALSEQGLAETTPPKALEHEDSNVAMMARCTTYKAESGRYVVLAQVVSSDRPSSWPLRHPVLIGLVFLAIMLFFFGLAWWTG